MRPTSSISSSDAWRVARGLARLAPIAALLVLANTQIDPELGTRRGELERLCVEELLAGRAVRRVGDDIQIQRLYVARASAPVDVLVLGSSRSLPVTGSQLGGRRLWNGSVVYGWLEEFAVLYLEAHRSRLAPGLVLLSLDVRHFQAKLSLTEVRPAFRSALPLAGRELGIPLMPWPTAQLLAAQAPLRFLSPGGFQRALVRGTQRLLQGGFFPKAADVRPSSASAEALRRPDGSISFPSRRPITPEPELVSAWKDDAVNPYTVSVFDAFVRRVRADGRRIVVLLPPYRPDYARRVGIERLFSEVEATIRQHAAALAVPLIGSFDAATAGCGADEFRDPVHPTFDCLDRIFSSDSAVSAGLR